MERGRSRWATKRTSGLSMPFPQETLLLFGAVLLGKSGVVGEGRHALPGQPGGGLLHLAARQAIDDAGLAGVLAAHEVQKLGGGLVLLDDTVADVGAVEAGNEAPGVEELQAAGDLLAGFPVGGGGQGDARH